MTPFHNPQNESEINYNIAHQKTRHFVEQCIGVLKSRFRSICRQRVLLYSPAKAGGIINACVILHNIMVAEGYPLPNDQDIEENIDPLDENIDEHIEIGQQNIQRIGFETRSRLANTRF